MALYHFSVSQIKRSAGRSALAAAAYRAGERLYSEYYDEISDYTHKGGVLHTEILLPAHAPECFRDRATLWNAVEAAERHPKAQLAYSFDIALQNELSLNENIELARAFVQKEFVDRGMIADLAIHSCMINTEAKIILSFHFCWPATKIHSDAVDYLLIPVVQLL